MDVLLSRGWILWEEKLYNIRSVRINSSEHMRYKKPKGKITCRILNSIDDISVLETIYKKYCDHHGFKRTIDLSSIISASDTFFLFEKDGQVVACTFSKRYTKSLVSLQFIYDFCCSDISMGKISQWYECEFANKEKIDYVYILGGYEKSSIYKMNFKGAEWWTGVEWSSDKELYNQLCLRDSRVVINDT